MPWADDPVPGTVAVPREDRDRPPAGTVPPLAARPGPPPGRRIPVVTPVAAVLRANPRLAVGLATAVAMVLVLILVTTIFTPAHKPGQQSPGSPGNSPSAPASPTATTPAAGR